MKTKTKSNPVRNGLRAYGEWEPKINVKRQSAQHGGFSRKVVTEGDAIVNVPIDTITALLRQGRQVILKGKGSDSQDAIRLFPCLNADLTEMFVTAQTIGDFRHSISDLKFTVSHRGKTRTAYECERMVEQAEICHKEAKKQQYTVCPTRHVTCPNCGADLELGSLIAGAKEK